MSDTSPWTKEERQAAAEWIRERDRIWVATHSTPFVWFNSPLTTEEVVTSILSDHGWETMELVWVIAQNLLNYHRQLAARAAT